MREILSTLFSPWNTSLYINVLQNITNDKCIRKLILAEPPLLLLYISISDSAWNWIVNNINSNNKKVYFIVKYIGNIKIFCYFMCHQIHMWRRQKNVVENVRWVKEKEKNKLDCFAWKQNASPAQNASDIK